MVFHSFVFLLAFLPAVLLGHWLVRRFFPGSPAQVYLLAISLLFYGWRHPSSLGYLGGSMVFNLLVAKVMASAPEGTGRRRWLVLGLVGNLGLLGVLKYTGFANSILISLVGWRLPLPALALPLGVSFFTLQQVMYLVDVYEGLVEPHGTLDHFSFVAFFPYLSMGPLVRSKQVMKQLRQGGQPTAELFARGLFLIAIGLCKKVILADSLALLADQGFARPGVLSSLEAWISSLAFTFQIYFDFSGYTDMAVGVAMLLGFHIPPNFRAPFRAVSISDFWQRWHITLSQFITTYLYTPLLRCFNKATLTASSLALLAAMTLAGLWHGASWTYVLFGALHGVALMVNQIWRKKVKLRPPAPLSWALTMALVLVAFIFFRAASVGDGLRMLRALVPGAHSMGIQNLVGGFSRIGLASSFLFLLAGIPFALVGASSEEWAARMRPTPTYALVASSLLLLALVFLNSIATKDFVYFAF